MSMNTLNQNAIDEILTIWDIYPLPAPFTQDKAIFLGYYPCLYSPLFPQYWAMKTDERLIVHDYFMNEDLFWVPEPTSLTQADILAFQDQWQTIRKDIGHEDMFARIDKEIEENEEKNKNKKLTYEEWSISEDMESQYNYANTKTIIRLQYLRTYKGAIVVPLYDKDGIAWNMQIIVPDEKHLLPKWKNGGCFYIIRQGETQDKESLPM